ncbi:MAG TPA: sorbosone dehydrogenase family protein [Vicinamibacterales bacterium]
MNPSRQPTRQSQVRLYLFVGFLSATALASAVVGAQRNAVHPQPRADQLPAPAKANANSSQRVPQPEGILPTVPAGFAVTSYAELRGPRMMVYAPNGDLFVSSPGANSIFVLRDANNDGVFESRGVFADGKTAPAPPAPPAAADGRPAPVLGVLEGPQALVPNPPACTPPADYRSHGPGGLRLPFGLAFHGDYLYVGNTDSIVRFPYQRGDLTARGAPEKLLDLPTGGHSTRNVVFNRAGTKLYIAVGSRSNSDAGEDCRRAAILEVNPDGSGARVYASGIRNPVGLTLQPGTDVVWAATNERDNLGDDLVPDYATSVKDGAFYGWPYSYIGRHYDPKYVGAFPDLVGRALVPDVLFPAHSAALGITFYTGAQFPARYRNGGFVALHGSWNRTVASGYRVVFFPMVNGKPGPAEDFLTGFLASTGENGTSVQQWGRPVGVAVAPDGALLVSDDSGNRIWKITASTAAPGR